jgi:hypothetical protein
MKTHRWIPHVVTQERVPVEALTGAHRTDPLAQASRRILILALVIGSLGADAAALAGYASADHANVQQPTASVNLVANASPTSSSHVTESTWMY